MNTLVIYHIYTKYPLRQTIHDLLYCFKKYAKGSIVYCNYAYGMPDAVYNQTFDQIIFHHSFTAELRSTPVPYNQFLQSLIPLQKQCCSKVVFCQDELINMEKLGHFINQYSIDTVYTVADPSQWDLLYPGINKSRTRIRQVLTGYLDKDILGSIQEILKETKIRDIDVGYRATHAEPWLGAIGKWKIQIAEVIKPLCQKLGLKTDISTVKGEGNFYHGLDWYRFMARCKVFIGVEGGSSLLDKDGTIRAKILEYSQEHPKASYAEIEAACFAEKDGNIHYKALSPRHLEACATKTCQLLLEGDYSGVLLPGIHYIAVKKDYSNAEEALKQSLDPAIVKPMVERAYKDIVATGNYSYERFVANIQDENCSKTISKQPLALWLVLWLNCRDALLWHRMKWGIKSREWLKKNFSNAAYIRLKKIKQKLILKKVS